jgi:hypothetical protein
MESEGSEQPCHPSSGSEQERQEDTSRATGLVGEGEWGKGCGVARGLGVGSFSERTAATEVPAMSVDQ